MLIILLLLLLSLTTPSLAETIPASDARLSYVGRCVSVDGAVSWDWTGTTIRIHWIGDSVWVRVSDTGRNRYNFYIDRPISTSPDGIIETIGDSTILLYAGQGGEHVLTLVKRSEGEQGRTTFHTLTCSGTFLPAMSRPLCLEFIGDSYSCGYGADGCDSTSHFTMETESVAKAFPMRIALALEADAVVCAHSGMGVIRNYNSKFPQWTMPLRYQHTFDMDSTAATLWEAQVSDWHPAMTVIFLGGNDFSRHFIPDSVAFVQEYQALLRQVKTNYGADYPILCVVKCKGEPLTRYVEAAVTTCSLMHVSWVALDKADYMPNGTYLGADSHPNEKAHQLIADTLLPIITRLLNR